MIVEIKPNEIEAAKISNLAANEGFRLLLKSLEAQRMKNVLAAAMILSETPTPNGQADAQAYLNEANLLKEAISRINTTINNPKLINIKYEQQ